MRKERATAAQEVQQRPPAAASGGGWLGWAGWGAKPAQSNSEIPGDDQPGLNEDQRKELYKAIDWDESEATAPTVDIPADSVLLRVKAKLERGSFALKTDPHGANKDLVSMNFDGFGLDLIQRPENFEATLGLGGLGVYDGTCEGSKHPMIVRVKDGKGGNNVPVKEEEEDDDDVVHQEADEDDGTAMTIAAKEEVPPELPFFWLKFEHNPLDGRADNALAVRLRHMEIIYHKGYVEAIFKFFKPPESQLESVGALIDVASSTLEGIRKETRAGLEYALAQHKTVDLHLDLNAVRDFLHLFLGQLLTIFILCGVIIDSRSSLSPRT